MLPWQGFGTAEEHFDILINTKASGLVPAFSPG
jgi:hypothetical protein